VSTSARGLLETTDTIRTTVAFEELTVSFQQKGKNKARHRWLMLIIPAILVAEMGRCAFPLYLRGKKKVHKTPSQTTA
jgi:hypothetical protein